MGPWTGFVGIALLVGAFYLASRNKAAINWRLVVRGLALQTLLAVFCLRVPWGQNLFHTLGQSIEKLLSYSDAGAGFVFGFLVSQPDRLNQVFGHGSSFIFAFKLVPTIIFVSTLVSIAYHLGIMQQLIKGLAWLVHKLMRVSGAEALSNAASIFVGQIEAQLLIKPYLTSMTRSELLAIMAGSMACISGGVMAVYIQMGIPANYLLTASIMSVPAALTISKLLLPETGMPATEGNVTLEPHQDSVNIIDAAARGAADGLKIGLSVCAMLIGFIALIRLVDDGVSQLAVQLARLGVPFAAIGLDASHLSLSVLLGHGFSLLALALGVPIQDVDVVGRLMGTKMVLNEFVAYASLAPLKSQLQPQSLAIVSVALCGFANFSSIAMQIGGIGKMAPSRKKDLAELGMMALFCGTAASYISAALAGFLVSVSAIPQGNVMIGAVSVVAALLLIAAKWLPTGVQHKTATENKASAVTRVDTVSTPAERPAAGYPLKTVSRSSKPDIY